VTGATPEHRYQVRVRGHLGETICCAFPDLTIRSQGNETVLTGEFADQAALYGLLAEIEALGPELTEVRRLSTLSRERAR
jgi:hypothetical protein